MRIYSNSALKQAFNIGNRTKTEGDSESLKTSQKGLEGAAKCRTSQISPFWTIKGEKLPF